MAQSTPVISTWICAADGLNFRVFASEQPSLHRKQPEQFSVEVVI
jgi:hypothetical protein